MAKPPDHARNVQHPVGGTSYQLHDNGRLWMRIGKSTGGQVDLGWPMNAYDSANVVTIILDGEKLRTTIRKVNEHAGSTPGTDEVEVVRLTDPPTAQAWALAVPPGGPSWARLERNAASFRVLDPSGTLRAEIDATANGLAIRAFDENGQLLAGQQYLKV